MSINLILPPLMVPYGFMLGQQGLHGLPLLVCAITPVVAFLLGALKR